MVDDQVRVPWLPGAARRSAPVGVGGGGAGAGGGAGRDAARRGGARWGEGEPPTHCTTLAHTRARASLVSPPPIICGLLAARLCVAGRRVAAATPAARLFADVRSPSARSFPADPARALSLRGLFTGPISRRASPVVRRRARLIPQGSSQRRRAAETAGGCARMKALPVPRRRCCRRRRSRCRCVACRRRVTEPRTSLARRCAAGRRSPPPRLRRPLRRRARSPAGCCPASPTLGARASSPSGRMFQAGPRRVPPSCARCSDRLSVLPAPRRAAAAAVRVAAVPAPRAAVRSRTRRAVVGSSFVPLVAGSLPLHLGPCAPAVVVNPQSASARGRGQSTVCLGSPRPLPPSPLPPPPHRPPPSPARVCLLPWTG